MTIGNSSLHQIARSNDRSLKTNLAQVLTDAPICQEARDDSVKSKYQRIVSGKIVHAHIVPTFSRKVDKDTGLDVKNNGSAKSLHSDRECLHSKEIDTESAKDEYITDGPWSKTIPIILAPAGKRTFFRLCIHPLTKTDFPKAHVITLSAPFLDLFLHWSHTCTPFNFRSYLQQERWDISSMGVANEDKVKNFFENYGNLVRQRVQDCFDYPTRFTAEFEIQAENSATLSFYETILEYRRIKLLSLEMRPSDWGFVLEDIKKDAARIELERSRLKNTLIQSIGVVARGNPALLVEGPGADAADPSESTPALSWNRIVREYLTHDGSSNDETPGVYLARKRAFILFTEKQGAQINAMYTRTMPLKISSQDQTYPDESHNYIVSIFSKKRGGEAPSSYILTLTSYHDPFFHFTSQEITPNVFRRITAHMNLCSGRASVPAAGSISSSKNYNYAKNSNKRSEKNQMDILGFHPSQGVGGVIGVVAGDCIAGIIHEPERYSAYFDIYPPEKGKKKKQASLTTSSKRNFKSFATWNWRDVPTRDYGSGILSMYTPTFENCKPPPRRQAVMRFMERVLFGDADVLSIDFHETNSDIVKDEIQSRFEKVHVEILLNQDRLKVLLETVRARSPGLLSELGKLSIPPTVWMARKMSGIVSQRKGRIGMPPITYHDDIDIHLGALQYGGTGCVELGCATDVGEKQNTHMNNSECSSLPHSLLPVKTQSSAEPRKLGAKYQAPSKYNINNTTSPTLTALKEQYQTAKLRVKAQQESVGKPIKNTIRVMENKEFSEGFGFYQDKDKSTQKKKKVVESVRASQEQLSQMFSQSPTAIRRALDTNHFRSGGFMQPDQLESFGWNF